MNAAMEDRTFGQVRRIAAQNERLKLNLFKLKALLDYTSEFGFDNSAEGLLSRFSKILAEDLDINRILYYLRIKDRWRLLINVNCEAEDVEALDVERDLYTYSRTTIVSSTSSVGLREIDLIIPVQQGSEPQAFVLLGDTNDRVRGVSPIIVHLTFAQTLTYLSFIGLRNLYAVERQKLEAEMRSQLELAANLQRSLIISPKKLPRMAGVQIATHYQPFYEVGGDYFDVQAVSNEELMFCVSDVSGKGIPASLLTANYQAHFKAQSTSGVPLEDIVQKLNSLVFDVAQETTAYITSFIARYNTRTHLLEYVNLGHNAPFLYNMKTGRAVQLHSCTVALAMLEELPNLVVTKVVIEDPTLLLCYTDGVTEWRVNGKEISNTNFLLGLLSRYKDARALVAAIASRMEHDEYLGLRETFDDISIVALKFTPSTHE
ncbi:MAG: PP2C family protein-serine/threonine phosphatase [Bacteroides sp.]